MTDQDPLATPATEVNTDYPLLKPDKIYRFNIKGIDVVSDADKDGATPESQTLVIKLATTKDELDINDEVLHAGYVVIDRLALWPKGERTLDTIKRFGATFLKAVDGKATKVSLAQLRDNPSMFNGKPVDAKVGIRKDRSGVYPDQNTVRYQIPN